MSMMGFVVLLLISIGVSAILHYWAEYHTSPGSWSFAAKVVLGYIGAWWGPTFFGGWGWTVAGVSVCTATVGALALLVLAIDVVNTFTAKPST